MASGLYLGGMILSRDSLVSYKMSLDGEKLSLEQIQAFLEGSLEFRFIGENREEKYRWANGTLKQQGYETLKRSARGLVRRFLEKTTGLSRAQVTRLVTPYLKGETVKATAVSSLSLPPAIHP